MYKAFQKFVESKSLFTTEKKLLLAFSGGADSVCLFYLLLKGGYNFSVAHCNFNLRGKESKADEKFVKALAKKNGISFYINHFDTMLVVNSEKISIQEAARKLRYDWFNELLEKEKFDKLLTAHHLTDNAETLLINMLRGTGISGLHGIPYNSDKLCRPLMFTNKSAVINYLNKNKIKYREDSSNAKIKYLRNNLRHIILEPLRKINPDFEFRFFQTSNLIKSSENLLNNLIEREYKTISTTENNITRIDKEKLLQIKDTVIFLYHAIKPCGFNGTQIIDIVNKQKKGRVFLSPTHKLTDEKNILVLEPLLNEKKIIPIQFLKPSYENIIGYKKIDIEYIKPSLHFNYTSRNKIYLNGDILKFPLLIRPWQAGDKFMPLGTFGHKKVSDYLTNKKIEKSVKSDILVVVNSDNIIVSVLPYTIHNDYAVKPNTKNILAITIKNL